MVRALQAILERTADENVWLGDLDARRRRRRLEALDSAADPRERWYLHVTLGVAELRLGREDEAIRQMTRARKMLAEVEPGLEPGLAVMSLFELGVAHLRVAETQNCRLRHSPESCILPIRGGGRHVDESGSRRAMEYFQEALRRLDPEDRRDRTLYLKAHWLLNLAAMTVGEYPQGVPAPWRIPVEAFRSEEPFPRFPNVAGKLGMDTHSLYGSAVMDDLDGDGLLDVLTTTFDPESRIHLFANRGDGTFEERAEPAGLGDLYGGINTVQADYDNDGDVDLYILRGAWMGNAGRHPNSLVRNNGDGTFTDVTFQAGLGEAHYPTQTAAWADYDNDGDLDLYVGNEHAPDVWAPSQLFRNNGDGTFEDVARQAGVQNLRFVKGVVWGDFDGDRYPDLYTSVNGGENRLYRNDRDGTFTDVAREAGVEGPVYSFPVWFWDFDNDGALDLYVPSYRGDKDALASTVASYLGLEHNAEPPRLYRGDGTGGFEDVASSRGLTKLHLPMGANFGDLENDGFPDVYLGTGYPDYEALAPNVMLANRRGDAFRDVTYDGGFGHLQKGHAIAFGDLDNDGDQDVFEQMGGIYPGDRFNDALFENPGFGNRWLALDLVGTTSNRSAIGARIHVRVREDGEPRSIYKFVNSGGSFGANPLRQHLGLGAASKIERLEIYWPTSDTTQSFDRVPLDRFLRVVEGADAFETLELPTFRLGDGHGTEAGSH